MTDTGEKSVDAGEVALAGVGRFGEVSDSCGNDNSSKVGGIRLVVEVCFFDDEMNMSLNRLRDVLCFIWFRGSSRDVWPGAEASAFGDVGGGMAWGIHEDTFFFLGDGGGDVSSNGGAFERESNSSKRSPT